MRILVTGSRDWTDFGLIEDTLNEYAGSPNLVIIHGDCPTGADNMAKGWAEACDITHEPHPAQWKKYGRPAAGPIRNQEMVDLGADICIAFPLPQSRGTVHCMNAARKAGIPVRVVKP